MGKLNWPKINPAIERLIVDASKDTPKLTENQQALEDARIDLVLFGTSMVRREIEGENVRITRIKPTDIQSHEIKAALAKARGEV